MSRNTVGNTAERLTGECLCGAVTFAFDTPTLWCAHCHCTMCQRAHGAAFVTWLGVDEDRFQVESDAPLRWYSSSPEAKRGFCTACGSTLFFRSQRWPGEIHIVLSNIQGEIDRQPDLHVEWDSHVPWVELGDSLPRRQLPSDESE